MALTASSELFINVTVNADGCLKFVFAPYQPITNTRVTAVTLPEGIMKNIFDIFAEKLGFCYNAIPAPLASPSTSGRGFWDGAIDMVMRGDAAMSSVFADTYERRQFVDFTLPLFIDESVVIYKRPELEPDIFGFTKPFTAYIWLLILLSAVSASLLFFFMYLVPSQSCVVAKTSGWSPILTSLDKSVTWSLYCLLGQSVPWYPSKQRLRMAFGLWLLITFILGTVYRSTVKAMLILPFVRLPFDSIDQLVKSKVDLVAFQGTAVMRQILGSEDGSKLGRLKPQLKSTGDQQALMEQILTGEIAYGSVKIPMLHLMGYQYSLAGKCETYLMSERLFLNHPIGLAITKGSPIKDKVDRIIRRLHESGTIDQMLKLELEDVSQCLKPILATISSEDIRQLSLKDFYGVFTLYAAGVILATWLFIFEILIKMTKEEKN